MGTFTPLLQAIAQISILLAAIFVALYILVILDRSEYVMLLSALIGVVMWISGQNVGIGAFMAGSMLFAAIGTAAIRREIKKAKT